MNKEQNKIIKEDEIDLVELAKVIWSKRKFITIVTAIFFVLGMLIASISEVEEYEASAKLLIEGSKSPSGISGISGLASNLIGVDILASGGGGGGVLPLGVYVEIIKSTPFVDKLLNTPIFFEKRDTTVTSLIYFSELKESSFSISNFIYKYTIGLGGTIKNIFKSNDNDTQVQDFKKIKRYSAGEWSSIEGFRNRLSVEINKKTNTINISTKMPDAVATAQLTDLLVEELTSYIIKHKLAKSTESLIFIQERFDEVKIVYEEKQSDVAEFINENRNITNPLFNIKYKNLQNEMNIAFGVYKGLASRLEQAKIKVKEETPVFSIIEPVSIPTHKSKSRKTLVVSVALIIGVFISIIIVFLKNMRMR